MKYKAKFVGRKTGAIGVTYPIETETEGTDRAKAHLALYDRFEHISQLELTPVCDCDDCEPEAPADEFGDPTKGYTWCGACDRPLTECPDECRE